METKNHGNIAVTALILQAASLLAQFHLLILHVNAFPISNHAIAAHLIKFKSNNSNQLALLHN